MRRRCAASWFATAFSHGFLCSSETIFLKHIFSKSIILWTNRVVSFTHMMIHTGEKLHNCVQCNKSFTRTGHLRGHMMIHTGEKLHNCAQCSKSFNQAGHLKQHLLTHSRDKLNNCEQCSKSFGLAGDLKKQVCAMQFLIHSNYSS